MDIIETSSHEDLWTPYKELASVVENYLAREGDAPYAVQTFESLLRRHKQTFLALMKKPAKNVTNREELKRGITEGVTIPSIGRTVLSKEMVDEAIIISDMYDVNEYLALELLLTAQLQAPRHPGLPRGLVAVLLYYDGRQCIVRALKELVTAREGVSWCIEARSELVSYVTRYTQQLIDEGLLERALETLRTLDLPTELEMLQNNRALGSPQHRRTVCDTFQSIRKHLAGVIFAASAQRGLARDTLMRLLSEVTRATNLAGGASSGSLDDIALALQMALLYALDLSVLHRREDGEELAKKLPLIQDPTLIPALLAELGPTQPGLQPTDRPSGARALCQLSLGLALAALKRAPQSVLRRAGNQISTELLDQDEALVDAAIDGKVLEYLDEVVLASERLHKEEYYMRRAHGLITDFIVLMHSKLMDLRLKADEAARTAQMYAAEGLVPPAGDSPHQRGHFDALLRCVERLYNNDPLNLKAEYWVAVDQQHSHTYRSGGRAATLYKFVRLSGELVAPPLLPPYLRALASLAQPHHTWALLARRDAAPAAHHHNQPAPVSAHHLFPAMYRYYTSLRQDPVPLSDSQLTSSMGASGLVGASRRLLVRKEEVEALIAALKLIQAIAKVDADACVAICENLQWDAVDCMFGLIACHVPISLKAELALALAALGSCAASAPRVWAAMEASQMIRSVPSTATYQQYGIHAELEEVESRNEEYPLTRAFLVLLESLCGAAPLPRALGAGSRTPGLDPYVTHVIQRIALPAPHRPYAKPEEKWQVLSLCTKLLVRWLDSYEPVPSDFPPPGRMHDTDPPPGFHILLQLHTKSDLLRLLLNTLDETVEQLEAYQPISGEEHMESCLVNVLTLLERSLMLERKFITEATSAGCSVIIVGLSKLILGCADGHRSFERLVSVCRVLLHGARLPAAAARAVSLLRRALQHPPAANHLLASLTANHDTSVHIRHGFVECMEAEEWSSDGKTGDLVRQTKEGIIQLLQQTLHTPAPNIAHYLLGFQLSNDVSRSALSEPGSAGYPRTVLHSLLALLDAHIAGGDNTHREANQLVENAYRLLYWLCTGNTAPPVLRFLRSRDNMLARHVKRHVNLENASVVTLSARSWMLRACACEVGSAAASRQHSVLATLLNTLTASAHHPTQEWEWCILRRLMEGLQVSVEATPEPHWELFHAAQLRRAIASCDQPSSQGGKRISVSRVHALLFRELSSLQATAPQRTLVAAEIDKVLDYVTEVNRTRNLAATLTHYYDSWRQLTEILFCVAPNDILNLESRKNLILNILQDLLNKISPADVLPQLGNLASGTILLLMVNLRHCYVMQKRNSNLKASEFELSFFGPSSHLMQTKSLSLKFILHKILSWILVSGVSTQKMRINLYGALLNYLNIVNLKSTPADGEVEDMNSNYVSRLDSSKAKPSKEESSLKNMVIDEISGFGENLCNVVCSDCVGAGHDVCRMVALSCLDALIEIHPHTDWMNVLTNRGYLRNLIDSLLQDDEGLKQVLEPSPKSMRVLYVYESKMTLLNKIASTRIGAEMVLEQSALSCLANMRVLDCHPDIHAGQAAHGATDFVPSVPSRYRQILLPALSLCSALLTTLGTENHSCIIHVTHFLLSHMETIDMVLRAAHPNSPRGLLVELEAITSVIARASNQEVFGYVEKDTALQDSAVNLYRVQCLMLALLPRFAGGRAALAADERAHEEDEPQIYYKIVSNLLTYARNILDIGGGASRVIFRPALAPTPTDYSAPESTPHLGAIVLQLQVMVERCHAQSKLLATLHNQLHNMPNTTLEDVKKLVGTAAEDYSPLEARQAALERVTRRADVRRRELAYCCYCVEGALYLVWSHLHFYLRRALDPLAYEDQLNNSLTPARALQAACASDLADLKKGLVSVFNDKFAEELLSTAMNQPPSQRGLLDILLRDIKSLIQFSPM